jgi:hypothetical protein
LNPNKYPNDIIPLSQPGLNTNKYPHDIIPIIPTIPVHLWSTTVLNWMSQKPSDAQLFKCTIISPRIPKSEHSLALHANFGGVLLRGCPRVVLAKELF